MDEAKKLLDQEAGIVTPANIAACFIMHATLGYDGLDKAGYGYFTHGVSMAQHMGLFSKEAAPKVYDPSHPERTRMRRLLAWSVYNHQALVGFRLVD